MLLRLAYFAATNAFTPLRLLPMSDRNKDIEIEVTPDGATATITSSTSTSTSTSTSPGACGA